MIYRLPARPDTPPLAAGATYQNRRLPRLEGRHTIRIVATRGQALGAVSVTEARAEGYHDRPAWKVAWVKRHDKRWVAREPRTTSELTQRFDRHWAPQSSWVHTIAIIDPVRCLPHQRDVLTGRSGQYVTSAAASIDPECEAVDGSSLERIVAIAHAAQARGTDRRAAKRKGGQAFAEARRAARLIPQNRADL